MNHDNVKEQAQSRRTSISAYPVFTIALSLLAIVATFLLSNSDLEVQQRTQGFSAIIAVYISFCVLLYFRQARQARGYDQPGEAREDTLERSLTALDEATGFFTGSLRSSDAFRLVAGRVKDLVPYNTIVLHLLNESRTKLIAVHADGERSDEERGREIDLDEGLPGQSYSTREVEIDGYMMVDPEQKFGSSVAIPLRHGDNVFGVMQLFFDERYDSANADAGMFEAVGNRVAPLMLGAISYERSQANALTDVTTDLPNERAFYLVLENQVAEAQRKRGERPLTVLAIDIKGFDEINCTFGHVAGDHTLNFVAQVIKDNLRQMDFIARALNDEFLVILPTADKEVSHEIIARIQTGFFGRKLAINEKQAVEIELNIGWAAFGPDGETPGQLLSLAQLRKEQAKSTSPGNILWFPQESSYPVN